MRFAVAAVLLLGVGVGCDDDDAPAARPAPAPPPRMQFNVAEERLAAPVVVDVAGGTLEVRAPTTWAHLPAAALGDDREVVDNWLSSEGGTLVVANVPAGGLPTSTHAGVEVREGRFDLNGIAIEQRLTTGEGRAAFLILFPPAPDGRRASAEVAAPQEHYARLLVDIESILGSLRFTPHLPALTTPAASDGPT